MITKIATIPEIDEYGFQRVLPFSRGGEGLEKYAASLPEGVQRYIDRHFKKVDGQHGVLVTAMSASEYWGSNSNGDWFFKKSLVHVPAGWTDDPETDKVLAKGWPYGYPTFYNAFPYAHHVNKDPAKAIGSLDYVTWDDAMNWVLAVVLVDEKKAAQFNGAWILDRLASGRPVPWSMGCRVPFDLSSLTPDWGLYEKAWASYDPKVHKSPAEAILAFHDKVQKIRGLSRTRKEYPDELLYHMNEINPDGTKSYAINDFPLCFDLSGVGVPADQVAWSIMKLGASHCELSGTKCAGACRGGSCHQFVPSGALLSERLEAHMAKEAGIRIASLGKGGAVRKAADIDKDVVPPVAGSSRVEDAEEARSESKDLPKDLLNRMGEGFSLPASLSTPSFMGMVLKPREFRRIVLIHIGKKGLADKLDDAGADMPFSFRSEKPEGLDPDSFDDGLAKVLEPFLGRRSCLGPVIHRTKIIVIKAHPVGEGSKVVDEEPEIQEKISALYNGYRQDILEKMAMGARYAINPRPWLRKSLYGFTSLDKVGSLTGSLVPLVTERTMEYLRSL